jgi:hypothetical protein
MAIGGGAPGRAEERPNELTREEQEAGWRLLFDGKTTDGWRGFRKAGFPARGWAVEEGCLRCLAEGGGDLVTVGRYADFELRFEWRVSARANSGVKYFVTEGRPTAIGHEYQILEPAESRAAKVPDRGSTGALYDCLAARDVSPRPPGEFNQSRIIVRGVQVEHWLNGVRILEYELGSDRLMEAVRRSKFKDVAGFGTKVPGHILLQDHGGRVWFRNLKILAR